MKRILIMTALIGSILCLLTEIFAQNRQVSPSVEIARLDETATRIKIDGRLDEPVWQQAVVLREFYQREPEEGHAVSEETRVFIAYDQNCLYIGADMRDREPARIVANVMRRDTDLQNNDSFEIYLDTFHDHRNLFFFATNALGAQRDGLIRNEGESQNWDWDGVWESAGQTTAGGWTAEVAIPFRTLRFSSDSLQIWGVNFARRIVRKREESYWASVDRDLGFFGQYKPAFFGHLSGFCNLHQGGVFEAKPFVVSGGSRDFEEVDGKLARQLDFGLDGKIHLTANLTADVTLNTDFAQVESDQEQVNLTRFDLFLPEKRDFFLENADVFRVGERSQSFELPNTLLFFSRQIGLTENGEVVPIIGGSKITGKAGNYDIGLLEVLTNETRYENDDEQWVDLPKQNFTVLRVKRDVLAKSSVGFLATSKDSWASVITRDPVSDAILGSDRGYNRVVAADVDFSFGSYTRVTGFVGKSQTAGVSGQDWAGTAFFSHDRDLWGIDFGYTDIQENFDAQIGFIQRTGIRKGRAIGYLAHRWQGGPIRQTYLFNDYQYFADQNNDLASRFVLNGIFQLFRDGAELFIATVGVYDVITETFDLRDGAFVPPGAYVFRNYLLNYQSDRSKPLSVSLLINPGGFYSGKLTALGGGFTLRPNANLALETSYLRNHIDLPTPAGKYATNLAMARLAYSFSPRLFAKLYIQYNDDDDSFSTNFLLNWIHRPGSNLYLVYNDAEDIGMARWRGRNRTLLTKFNYLLGL